MPTLPQGRLLVLSFSLVLSCVVIGVSFSLLYAPKPGNIPESDEYNVLAMKWRRFDYLLARDPDPFFDYDGDGFRTVPILGMVTSALNIFLGVILLVASSLKRKTIIPVVAIEAPCIYVVSFLWLATGAYAEHSIETGTNCFLIVGPYCAEHKVLEGIAFINFIQLMLYANTLMTVATICHVRKHLVWLRPVTELPTFAAPALTFGSSLRPDVGFGSPFMSKINQSEVPILGVHSPSGDSRGLYHFRSRMLFPPHPPSRPGALSPSSDSVTSLITTVSTQAQSGVATQNSTHQAQSYPIVLTGEPPTYSGPGSTYELVTV